ncbi:MAG: hypothetical protein U9P50_03495 [Patescibacteria group bacterium]|nr:hypothetical protein [Patescibacteria group bacterium]
MEQIIKNKFFKNWVLVLIILFLLLLIAYSFGEKGGQSDYALPVAKAAINDNISGYAWSDNIGWIGFNCIDPDTCSTSNYGVSIGADKKLSGYAWSDNVGWISFNENELSGCPTGVCRAKLNGLELNGWAKALAGMNADDGWDGWISLSKQTTDSINYGVVLNENTNFFEGYAWAGEVVGWVDFNPAYGGVEFIGDFPVIRLGTFQVASVVTGNRPRAVWETEHVVSCDLVSDTGYEDLDVCHNENQCEEMDLLVDMAVMEETTYTITCFNDIGMSVTETHTPLRYFELNGSPNRVTIDFSGGGATTTPVSLIGVTSWNGFNSNISFSADLSQLPESPGDGTTNLAIFSRPSLSFAEYFTAGTRSALEVFASYHFIGQKTVAVEGNGLYPVSIIIDAGNIEPVYEEI